MIVIIKAEAAARQSLPWRKLSPGYEIEVSDLRRSGQMRTSTYYPLIPI